MKKIIAFIPNLLTLCNLLSGVLSIYTLYLGIGGLYLPSLLLLLAALFDVFDGLVARLLRVESSIGADLDSLSDVVSFGVAPIILLLYAMNGVIIPRSALSILLAIPLFIPTLCGAYRLARFNNRSDKSHFFSGMPIPANALFWVGYAFFLSRYFARPLLFHPMVLYFITLFFALVMGCFMVSDIRFLSLKGLSTERGLSRIILIIWGVLALALIVLVSLFGVIAFAFLILCYALCSIILSPRINRAERESAIH